MPENILHIKNMVCSRCIKVVKEELEKLGLKILSISLGEANVKGDINSKKEELKKALEDNGFELLEDRRSNIIEMIKIAVIDSIRNTQNKKRLVNYSDFLAKKIGYDYNYLSTLFSSTEQITIEHYIILQKIERAKELLKYGELTLSEIAYQLGYSSVQHLSNQFRKVTGMTASRFKELNSQSLRKPLDSIN